MIFSLEYPNTSRTFLVHSRVTISSNVLFHYSSRPDVFEFLCNCVFGSPHPPGCVTFGSRVMASNAGHKQREREEREERRGRGELIPQNEYDILRRRVLVENMRCERNKQRGTSGLGN